MPASPLILIRPRVMPRPIQRTFPAFPWISSSSPGAPSTSKKSSTRCCRLPRCTGSARIASRPSEAITSGERASASRGTDGGSFSLRVIMVPGPSLARVHVGPLEALQLDRVVVEGHRVDLLEERARELLDLRIVCGLGDELAAVAHGADLPLLHGDLAAL